MSTQTQKRVYRKRARAESEEETRLRITEAIMNLHEKVGPARTTVSAIADLAGVQRATVYRHFPDVEAQVDACSTHWLSLNAPPDPSAWPEIGDPDERLRVALDRALRVVRGDRERWPTSSTATPRWSRRSPSAFRPERRWDTWPTSSPTGRRARGRAGARPRGDRPRTRLPDLALAGP